MKQFSLSLLTIPVLLAGCTSSGSHSMMNNGGMMNHNMNGMQHGNTMMPSSDSQQTTDFLPGQEQDLSSLPQAKPSETLHVTDGETIRLSPTIVRKTINGKTMAMYGYNGEIPGPLLQVQQGSTFTVKITNTIDIPTSIHWHGVRLENKNDGAVGLTQKEVAPGESFTYTVKVPDEGMYWYHTHVREDVQQPMGLYGGILVTPKNADAYAAVDKEQIVILNDLLVDESGMPVPYGKENADRTLMGRFGNVFLVNGEVPQPVQVGLGSVVRFSVLNASNTRTYRIVQPKGSLLKIVGGDSGRYEKEFMANTYTLAPSERVIVELYFWDDEVNHGKPAERTVALVQAGAPSNPTTVFSATIVGGVVGNDRLAAFKKMKTNTDVVQSIDPFRSSLNKAPDHTIVLDMSMMGGMMEGHGMMGSLPKDGIEWKDTSMNTMPMSSMMKWQLVDEKTGAANKDLVYTAKMGDKVKIRIINKKDSPHPMQHPIHFHGQRFLVLADNDVQTTDFVWKDTVLVPAGHTVDILLDASNPGDWMFHCHIAEHLSNGMMGLLTVLP